MGWWEENESGVEEKKWETNVEEEGIGEFMDEGQGKALNEKCGRTCSRKTAGGIRM